MAAVTASQIDIKVALEGIAAVNNGFTSLQTKLSGLARGARLVAGAFGIALTGKALLQAQKNAINTADEMGKLAQKTGVAVQSLSQLVFTAQLGDVSSGELQLSLRHLARQMEDTGRSGVSVDQELLRLADRFAAMPDGVAKTNEAIKNFGRSGEDMIPFLNQGSEAIRKQMEQARQLGVEIGPEFAQNADHFNDNVTLMKARVQGLFLGIADKLLPSLNELTDGLVKLGGDPPRKVADGFKWMVQAAAAAEFKLKQLGAIFRLSGEDRINELQRLQEEFDQFIESMEEDFPDPVDAGKSGGAKGPSLLDRDETNAAHIGELQSRIRVIQSSVGITAREISQKVAGLQTQELHAINQQVEALKKLEPKQLFGEGDDGTLWTKANQQHTEKMNGLLERQAELQRQIADNSRGNAGLVLFEAFNEIQDRIGTTAEIVARGFASIVSSAIDGVAASIKGLINLTMTWGEALRNIGMSIVQSIIDSFSRMVAEWIISHVIMKAVAAAFTYVMIGLYWLLTGEQMAAEATKTPLLSLNAVLAAIGTEGVAAAIGVAAFVAALGVGLAAAMGAFESGGPTGPGRDNEVAGVVHRNEWVMSADTVRRWGPSNMRAIESGQMPSGASPATGGRGIGVHLWFDKNAMREHMLNSSEGRQMVIDMVGENKHQFMRE
jgi:hypothetical protein